MSTVGAGSGPAASETIAAAPKRAGARGAISLRAITKRYGDDRVVDTVSLEIQPGEFFSLLGPSGSGKTTTLMMIAGFAGLDEGQILVDGVDIASEPPQKRGFGMVFQNYAIFPHLNVFENVAFPLRARRVPAPEVERRVTEALALVRLERFAERFARQFSGGQQQRVAIARAIVFEPKVVLMDEPLGALDKNLRYEMQVEIKDIQRRLGMTVVYVTHDQEEAMNMSDRLGIMNRGRVEQVGQPAEIYERPVSTFIARFLGEANLLPGQLREVSDDIAMIVLPGGLVLRAVAPKPLAAGMPVNLFVRPERITLTEGNGPPAAALNRAAGRIRRMSFLGNILRYVVEVERGGDHRRRPERRRSASRPRPSDRALLGGRRQPGARGLSAMRGSFSDPGVLLVPAFTLLAILFVLPLGWFFVGVFAEAQGIADLADWFATVLTSRAVVTAMITTNWISLLVTAMTLLVGYPIAYYLATHTGWRFALVLFCIIVPYFTSVIVRTYSWMVLLGRNGIINQALQSTGLIDAPLPLLYNKTGVLIGMTYVLMPYMILTLYAAMRGIDPSLTRAAYGLGAGRIYTFWRVYLPAQPARGDLGLADRLHPGDRVLHHAGAHGRPR